VVLVAAASNEAVGDQGAPASTLQPHDGPDIDKGRGLVVTAVDFADQRAGTGVGTQISMSAYGFFVRGGPPGLLSTYPGGLTLRDLTCNCRATVDGDNRYAYLQGTSMAAPQVAAAAALVGEVNPALSAPDKLRILKDTARRSGGWTSELGWGILHAGRAVDAARRVDRTTPASQARARRRLRLRPVTRRRGRRAVRPRATLRLRWSGSDPAGAPGLVPSGLRGYDVFLRRGKAAPRRIATNTHATRMNVRFRRSGGYTAWSVASDAAGNREADPARPDARIRVLKPKRKRSRRRR
jgi:hypothetical protein